MLLLLALAAAPTPADTLRYVVRTQGNLAGRQTTVRLSKNASHISFEFNDRGRGPKTETDLMVDQRGVPIAVTITGLDYLKEQVDERLEKQGPRLTWKSRGEAGSSTTPGAFYLPKDGPPEASAALVRALLSTRGKSIPVLPGGRVRLEEVERKVVTSAGGSKRLVHYAIHGLGFSPEDIWLEEDGTYFASLAGWQRIIREGWDGVTDELAAAQDSAEARRLRDLATRLADRPRGPVALVNGTLFDAPNARLVPGQTVLIEGNQVKAVGPSATIRLSKLVRIVDLKGKTVLPGLWDMHAHLGPNDGLLDLAAGVTSVRDMANDIDYLLATRKSYDAGTTIGPRVVMAGFIDGPGPYAGPTKVLLSTPDQVREWVDKYADMGYEQIKLYSSLDPTLVPIIAERAHARGLRLSGHVPKGMTATTAVKAGYDEIQHTNMLFLNFLGDTLDTRTPLRFIAVAKHGADLDLGSDSVKAFLHFLKEHGTVVDPTVATFEDMFTADPGMLTDGKRAIAARLPSEVRRNLAGGGLPADGPTRARYRASYAKMLAMVKALFDAGIPIVAGTDCLTGFCLHRELELYVKAGIPAASVLRIATWEPARIMKRTDRLGSIEPGKLADLIVVAGNPVERISDIRKVDLVIKDGVIYDPTALYRELGVGSWRTEKAR